MMNSEHSGSKQSSSLSTLVGYITGPKAEQPVGVRVVEPPSGTRQRQRGKLYALVDLLDDHQDGAEICDHLLTVIQRTYYTAKGSQSNVMIESLRRAHQVIQEINQQYPDSALRAGVLCAALLNDRLVIVASGSAMALVRINDQVQMFPSELSSAPAFDGDVPMQIFRQKLGPDDAIFLGSSKWTEIVSIKTLAGIVAYVNEQNCTDAADELYAKVGEGAPPGCFIVMVDRQYGANSTTSPPNHSSVTSGGNGTSRFFGLPTAVNVTPSRQSGTQSDAISAPTKVEPPETDQYYSDSSTIAGTYARDESPSVSSNAPARDSYAPPSIDQSNPFRRADSYNQEYSSVAEPEPQQVDVDSIFDDTTYDSLADADDDIASQEPWSKRMSVAAVSGMGRTKRFLSRMLPEGSERGSADDVLAPEYTDLEEDELTSSMAPMEASSADTARAKYGPKVSPPPLPAIEPFTTPKPASGTRARLLILVALIILIVVPAVVYSISIRPTPDAENAETYTTTAQQSYQSALTSYELGDMAGAREKLVESKNYLASAIELDGSTQERLVLASSIEQLLQDVLQIKNLYGLTTPLIVFGPDASPKRVLVADSSVYVLDGGEQAVLRYRYDPTEKTIISEQPQTVLRMGDVIEGATVGTLGDIAWLPLNPGFADKPTLLILDRNNNLFSYDPRVEGARRYILGGEEYWQNVSQVQAYNGRIYIADEGANAIYRYVPGQDYLEPDNWFADDTLVNLAGAQSMEIDGDIWLLLGSGNIMRYQTGEQLPFSLENSIGLADDPVDMYVTTEGSNKVYIVDAGDERILVYDKNGAYQYQLRAPEGDPLRGISGLFIDEIDGTMFILTKSGLYSHPVI